LRLTASFIRTRFAVRNPRVNVEVGEAGRVGAFFVEAFFHSEEGLTFGRHSTD
jgi:hypothetical protein